MRMSSAWRENVELWQEIDAVLLCAQRVLLAGPPGTGKTFAGYALAKRRKEMQGKSDAVFNVTLTENTGAAELRGFYLPRGQGAAKWHDGLCSKAWRTGAVLILDEVDDAGDDSAVMLHHYLNDPAYAQITLPNDSDEQLKPDRNFVCVATMNGTFSDLHPALLDRFPVRYLVTGPHPGAIEALPERYRDCARTLAMVPQVERRISVRAWMELSRLEERGIPVKVAFNAVFGAYAHSDREEIYKQIQLAKAPLPSEE